MKVWVLERFYTVEELQNQQADIYELAETQEQLEKCAKVFDRYTEIIRNNPNGVWLGISGKTNYNQFCFEARGVLLRNPDRRFRVVKADIPFDSVSWLGYRNPIVNEKVLRFLYATIERAVL